MLQLLVSIFLGRILYLNFDKIKCWIHNWNIKHEDNEVYLVRLYYDEKISDEDDGFIDTVTDEFKDYMEDHDSIKGLDLKDLLNAKNKLGRYYFKDDTCRKYDCHMEIRYYYDNEKYRLLYKQDVDFPKYENVSILGPKRKIEKAYLKGNKTLDVTRTCKKYHGPTFDFGNIVEERYPIKWMFPLYEFRELVIEDTYGKQHHLRNIIPEWTHKFTIR